MSELGVQAGAESLSVLCLHGSGFPNPQSPIPVSPPGTLQSTWAPRWLAGRGTIGGARPEGEAGPAPGAPMAPRAPRPDADVSFPSHYTSRHYLLRLPRKSRPILRPSPQISSFSASWSFPPVLGLKGGAPRAGCLLV